MSSTDVPALATGRRVEARPLQRAHVVLLVAERGQNKTSRSRSTSTDAEYDMAPVGQSYGDRCDRENGFDELKNPLGRGRHPDSRYASQANHGMRCGIGLQLGDGMCARPIRKRAEKR